MNRIAQIEKYRRQWHTSMFICALLLAASPAISALDGKETFTQKACASCHGEGGGNPLPGYPRLAEQDKAYLIRQMRDIKSGARSNGLAPIMTGYMATVSDEEIVSMAAYLAGQE